MARIRSIKPEFWSDEKLSECSLSARLTFIGLWTFADDEGRMEYQPARLRMQIFPCGSVTMKSLTEWLGELSERSLIRVYEVDGKTYLDIPNFAKHQRINRPTASKFPEPPHGVLTEHSVSTHGVLTSGRDMEGKGKGECADAREPSVRKSPLAEPPPGLNHDAWSSWVGYRRGIGKPIKPASFEAAMKALAKFGADQAAVVEQSIAMGWQGLFPLKDSPKPAKHGGGDNGLPFAN